MEKIPPLERLEYLVPLRLIPNMVRYCNCCRKELDTEKPAYLMRDTKGDGIFTFCRQCLKKYDRALAFATVRKPVKWRR